MVDKTLKDIEGEFVDEHNKYIIEELKKEIIPQIKDLQISALYNQLGAEYDEDRKELIGTLATIKWIKHFFNITEEDLKI